MSQANITDVAKAANVSVATVSRALNEPEKVSTETQNRIKEAIKELNYRPNRLGVRLRKQKTNVLLVLVSDLGNPFFSDILYGMDETAQKHGYSLMVVSTYFNTERERSSLLALEQRTVDGAVLLSSMLPTEDINYYDAHFPIIQCCDFNEDSTAMHVSIDNYKATEPGGRILPRAWPEADCCHRPFEQLYFQPSACEGLPRNAGAARHRL